MFWQTKLAYSLLVMITVLVWGFDGRAQQGNLNRPYEPLIMKGIHFPAFAQGADRAPVDHLYLYVYHQTNQSWEMIPFQIDEIGNDEYFGGDDGRLDDDDELVFMAQNLGDRATPAQWLNNTESRSHVRYEIEVTDPIDSDKKAWGYLYRSSTISEPVPGYEMAYDSTQDVVSTRYYRLRFNETGLLCDVTIKSTGGGNGVEFMDRQKLRLKGLITLGVSIIPIEATEEYLKADTALAIVGPVRIVRRMQELVIFGVFQFPFSLDTFFYPWSGFFGGSSEIPEEILKIELFRQSWDLNENAKGMYFFSENNSNIPIDGSMDQVDTNLIVPGYNWMMTTGDQGTFLNIVDLPQLGDNQKLYYYDSVTGDTGDNTVDTGDSVSYGDAGVLITGTNFVGSFSYSCNTYFLSRNQDPSVAKKLVAELQHPLDPTATEQGFSTGIFVNDQGTSLPDEFELYQNYPNPFNPVTTIAVNLPKSMRLSIRIFDVAGQTVAILANGYFDRGRHEFVWTGQDMHRQPVPSGLYFYELRAVGFTATKKMLLVR